jgi:hypothetical protein
MLPWVADRAFLCPVVSDPDVSDAVDVLDLVLTAVPGKAPRVTDGLAIAFTIG